jgi:protein required for attachment to host cells
MVHSRNGFTGRTWVVVADSSNANIYLRRQRNSPLQEVASFHDPLARLREQDLKTDTAGRHTVATDASAREHERESFAREVCGRVEKARGRGEFEELILIASPRLLGLLRDSLSRPTLGCVSREIPKNLVQMQPRQLQPYLSE